MSYKTAKDFWQSIKKYPDYPNTKQRRLIDTNFIVNHTDSIESVLDIGCGDGYLLVALREFTKASMFYGYDISEELLNKLHTRWGNTENLETVVHDFTKIMEYPETDLTTSMGLFPYIFDDASLYVILKNIKSNVFIMRAPCTVKEQSEYINKYSEDLGSYYSAIYRTVSEYTSILSNLFDVSLIERCYSDNIESSYGTKHYFFVCKSKDVIK